MFGYGGIPASLDAIARCLIAADAPHLVMGLRQPDERLRLALAETGVRFVVALDLPIRAVADLLETTDADPIRAVRAVANSCAAVMRFPPLPGALLLHADATRAAPDVAITALASHLGAALDEAEPARIAARLATNPPHAADSGNDLSGVSETARHTMQAALSGYQECFAGQGMGQLVWSRDLFLAGSGDERAGDILELAGGARILVVGPDTAHFARLLDGPDLSRCLAGGGRVSPAHRGLCRRRAGRRASGAGIWRYLHGRDEYRDRRHLRAARLIPHQRGCERGCRAAGVRPRRSATRDDAAPGCGHRIGGADGRAGSITAAGETGDDRRIGPIDRRERIG